MSTVQRLGLSLVILGLLLFANASKANSITECRPYNATHMICSVLVYNAEAGGYLPSSTYFVPYNDIYIDP